MNLSESQTIVFLEILRILRNEKNRIARKKIYEAYIDKKLENLKLNKTTRSFVEKLIGDFDEIGFLVEEFNLKDNLFLLYSDTIRRIWIALQYTIKKEQNERNKNDLTSEQFSYYFTQLATEAKKYRERKNLQEPGFTDLRQM
tara:strand:- start:434 stop:862 length:429 start_codon:yes stop_codon:yes gene_type:complete